MSGTNLLHLTVHPLRLVREDDDNSMRARDTKNVINAYVLRELDRESCVYYKYYQFECFFFLNLYSAFCFKENVYVSMHQCVHTGCTHACDCIKCILFL